MPVTFLHPEYQASLPLWKKCRDCIDGEEAVKAAEDKYLPHLDTADKSDYDNYKGRASFFAATSRTVEGLTGAIIRKAPEMRVPDTLREILDDIGVDGEAFEQIIKVALDEAVGLGRIGFLVDAPRQEGGEPYVAVYKAENIINWKRTVLDGERTPSLITLKEERPVQSVDVFDSSTECVYRVLRLGFPSLEHPRFVGPLDEDEIRLIYFQEIWIKDEAASEVQRQDVWVVDEVIIPRVTGGFVLDRIPFVVINPTSTDLDVEKPPIIDLVNVNLSHYRNSADLEHGLHFTALPTAWVAGFDPQTKLYIGSKTAWVAETSDARAGFLEFTGAGLGSISAAMDRKEKQMAVLGSRLLEEQRKTTEASETVKLRQSGEHSVLANISIMGSRGLTKLLQLIGRWKGFADTEIKSISLKLNSDFNLVGLSPQQITALMMALQQGAISWQTWFYNLQRGELIPDGIDADAEAALIAAGTPQGDAFASHEVIADEKLGAEESRAQRIDGTQPSTA